MLHADRLTLADYLDARISTSSTRSIVDPDDDDVRGFRTFLDRWVRGLAVERAAGEAS